MLIRSGPGQIQREPDHDRTKPQHDQERDPAAPRRRGEFVVHLFSVHSCSLALSRFAQRTADLGQPSCGRRGWPIRVLSFSSDSCSFVYFAFSPFHLFAFSNSPRPGTPPSGGSVGLSALVTCHMSHVTSRPLRPRVKPQLISRDGKYVNFPLRASAARR